MLPKKAPLLTLAGVFAIAAVTAGCLWIVNAQREANVRQFMTGLGAMKFTSDAALAKTVKVDPAKDSSISVTDKQGYVWTLTVPAGSLATATDITMTPFATVNGPSDEQITTGVRFAPDGLAFSKPALLSTVAPAGKQPLAQIYTAKDDGSQLAYATTAKDGQAELFHFSTAGASPKQADPAKVKQQFADTLNGVDNYLGTKDSGLPVPPDYNIHCIDNTTPDPNATDAIRQYAIDATEPERSIALRLLAIEGLAQKDKVATDSQNAQSTADLGKLYDRIDTKLVNAMNAYHNDQNKFAAIWSATVSTSAILQAAGREDTKSLNVLGNWTLYLVDQSLKSLREEHAYSNIQEIAYLRAGAMRLDINTSKINDEIDKAYHFKLKITEDYTATAIGARFNATGEIPLTAHGVNIYGLGLTGSSTLKNTYSYGSAAGYFYQNAPTFDTSADVTLINMCKTPKAFMSQDKYGASTDTGYNFLGATGSEDALQQLFSDYLDVSHSGDHQFIVKAQDKNATAAKLDWTNTYSQPGFGSATLSLQYELIHDPQK